MEESAGDARGLSRWRQYGPGAMGGRTGAAERRHVAGGPTRPPSLLSCGGPAGLRSAALSMLGVRSPRLARWTAAPHFGFAYSFTPVTSIITQASLPSVQASW